MVDFFIGTAVFYFLMMFENFEQYYLKLDHFFIRLVGLEKGSMNSIESKNLSFLLLIFLCSQVIKFYSNLLLGRSLGQMIYGADINAYPFWKRVGGAFRVVIGTFSTPFIIFDLPLIFGKQTFKEVISFTTINFKGRPHARAADYITFFAFGLFFVLAPFLQNFNAPAGPKLYFLKKAKYKIKKDEVFDNYHHYTSNKFKMATFSSLAGQRYRLFPSYDVIKINKKRKFQAVIRVFDEKYSLQGKMKIHKKISLLKLLNTARLGNPVFYLMYPNIFKLLQKSEQFEVQKGLFSESRKATLFDKKTCVEIQTLIQSSFEMKATQFLSSLLKQGPFLNGGLNLKKSILSLLDETTIPEIDFIELGDHLFLKISQKRMAIADHTSKQIIYFLPLQTENAIIQKIVWDDNEKAHLSMNQFIESFITLSKWAFDYRTPFAMPSEKAVWSAFNVQDFYTKNKMSADDRAIVEVKTLQYLDKLYTLHDENKDIVLANSINDTFDKFYLLLRVKNKQKELFFSLNFTNELLNLKNKLKKKKIAIMVKKI